MKLAFIMLITLFIAGCAGTLQKKSAFQWKPKMWQQTQMIPKPKLYEFRNWPDYRF